MPFPFIAIAGMVGVFVLTLTMEKITRPSYPPNYRNSESSSDSEDIDDISFCSKCSKSENFQ
jgi:hypothetical protein